MKKLLTIITVIPLLVACQSTLPESDEAVQYKNYAAAAKAKWTDAKLSPPQRNELFQKTYEESGMQEFIVATLPSGSASKGINELTTFYKNVILGKYDGHLAQDYLKVRFISFAVPQLDLKRPENSAESDLLVKLTRDLIACNQIVNGELIYDCLSASKGLIDKEEYNEMVKRGKFQMRLSIEETRETISKKKDFEPEEPYQQLANSVRGLEQRLSDLDGLKIK